MKGIDASRKKLLTSQNSAENKSKALTGKIQDLGEAMDRHSSVLQYKKTQLGKNKSQIGVIEQQVCYFFFFFFL